MRRPGFKFGVGEQLKRRRGLTDPEVQQISTSCLLLDRGINLDNTHEKLDFRFYAKEGYEG